MLSYTGIECPVCEKEFKDNDDIVVCPKCGAPYHRHCYAEKGECIFGELHEKGESWAAPEPPAPPKASSPYEIKDQECPKCGVLNAHSALFCSACESPLKIEPESHANSKYTRQGPVPPVFTGGPMPIVIDPMGGVKPSDIVDENISYGEVSKVVQQNSGYYIPVFERIKKFKRNKFNFSAFLFSGGWLLYRKQYKMGIIFTIIMFALYLGQLFTTFYVSLPRIADLVKGMGQTISDSGITVQQMVDAASAMSWSDTLIVALPTLMLLAMLGIMIFLGVRGNKMYLKHCIRTVNQTRKTTISAEDYNSRIMEKGGVNTPIALCLLICYFLCTYLPNFLILNF